MMDSDMDDVQVLEAGSRQANPRREWLAHFTALAALTILAPVSAWAQSSGAAPTKGVGHDAAPNASSSSAVNAKGKTILVVGDSLSAEYGLKRGAGWVALLDARLAERKFNATVINASISGDTTSGGRSRLPALLKQHQPNIVIIELGANDALRGLALGMTRDNLGAMAQAAKGAGAKVMIVGMQLPPNYGRKYGDEFAGLFAAVAKTEGASLVPFLLRGVADVPQAESLFQADRIHPNEAAHPAILENVWPVLERLLAG
jgi:acyl-CoA thioesterase-1